ncbi:hypothetical protein [Acinetobacter sp. A47]|uniref:hypothetical protein n=1 Tax=Acinetobacter sp. A47 TaxID=1561217 RepID=UPI001D0D359F|nr:hypothetical protein [Acinetobacter sp. A47]
MENNSKVKTDRFQETRINRLESHPIQIQVFNAPFKPDICEFTLNYDATEDYETVFFISDMMLKLYNRAGQRIGLSEYHVSRGDGLDLTKCQGNDVKINRVIDGLLDTRKK